MNRPRIGRSVAESTAVQPRSPKPAAGSPNVVVVVLDDVGFAQLGCFGSDLATPTIDRLAANGLRFNRFHVTSLCSPTRACLLTGRNHHAVGMGFLTDIPMAFPGYDGRIPKSAAALPRLLKDAGYSSLAVGKWHLAPRWEQSASGPFERWPLGLGFERFYGFLGGDTNQWTPELVADNGFVAPPRSPDEGYHLSEDLADTAMRMVQDQQQATPGKPFFLYFAPGAAHAPHQAPREWLERERGRFELGWDAWRDRNFARQRELGIVPAGTQLSERPPWVPAWASLSAQEKRVYARLMEAFSAMLAHTDAQLARLVDFLEQRGQLDNTLLVLLSDNGASAEGGPTGLLNEHSFMQDLGDELERTDRRLDDVGGFRAYNHYPWGWAWAGNSPFKLWKRFTWLGGVRTPMLVHWPKRIPKGGAVRGQFCHAIDLFPTILAALGLEVPPSLDGVEQLPVDGASLLPAIDSADAPSPRDTQYFEMLGSRAIYHAGWKATTDHVGNQVAIERALVPGSHDFDHDRWSLYELGSDFAEVLDLADAKPEQLRKLVELWWTEAGRNQVLPLEDSFMARAAYIVRPPHGVRTRVELRPGGGPVAEESLPPSLAGLALEAELTLSNDSESGIVAALGDWNNGWALYLVRGRPVFALNLLGDVHRFEAVDALPAGARRLRFELVRRGDSGGDGRLSVDGKVVAEARIARALPVRWQIGGAGLLVGYDRGFPVCDDYQPPFHFTGTIGRVIVELPNAAAKPEPARELASALRHE